MFDTMKIARRIRQARIEQNLTQMQLADRMGISYQAVSNWERGNSMPDISKLEELCGILGLSIDELLGQGQEAQTIGRVLRDEEVSPQELAQVAPVLPPEQIARQAGERKNIGFYDLISLAPFLDQRTLVELCAGVEVEDLWCLDSLAPFIDRNTMDDLVGRYQGPVEDLSLLYSLAPFLTESGMDALAARFRGPVDLGMLSGLAPLLSKKALGNLMKK